MADMPWLAVAALVDPVRRALYEHVRQQPRPVTREQAADAAGVSRSLCAFHLEKLVEVGLLEARYESPEGGRRGRGRTPKVYRAGPEGVSLTVPPRQYELVGQILADAVAQEPTDSDGAARRLAYDSGHRIGATSRSGPGQPAPDPADALDRARTLLAELGFEPRVESGPPVGSELTLGNCPFHALAQHQPELICGINEAFIAGLLAGLGACGLAARLAPQPGSCCVRLSADQQAD